MRENTVGGTGPKFVGHSESERVYGVKRKFYLNRGHKDKEEQKTKRRTREKREGL